MNGKLYSYDIQNIKKDVLINSLSGVVAKNNNIYSSLPVLGIAYRLL